MDVANHIVDAHSYAPVLSYGDGEASFIHEVLITPLNLESPCVAILCRQQNITRPSDWEGKGPCAIVPLTWKMAHNSLCIIIRNGPLKISKSLKKAENGLFGKNLFPITEDHNVLTSVCHALLWLLATFILGNSLMCFKQSHLCRLLCLRSVLVVTLCKNCMYPNSMPRHTVNVVISAGGKFRENVGKTFYVGVIFTILLLLPSYRYMGLIFAWVFFFREEDISAKNAKITPTRELPRLQYENLKLCS